MLKLRISEHHTIEAAEDVSEVVHINPKFIEFFIGASGYLRLQSGAVLIVHSHDRQILSASLDHYKEA